MTVKTDAAAITPSANAKAVAVAKGAQVTDLMGLISVRAIEMQKLIAEIIKLSPPTTRSVTVAGTPKAGDVLQLTITPSGGSLIAINYTMTGSDTAQSGALNLATLINANATLQAATVTTTVPVAGVFNISYALTPTISSSVGGSSPTDTLTAGSASGGTDAANLTSLNSLLGELL